VLSEIESAKKRIVDGDVAVAPLDGLLLNTLDIQLVLVEE